MAKFLCFCVLLFVLASCNPFGQLPGPDKMYDRLAQNRGQWQIGSMYYHHQRADGSTVADSVLVAPGDVLFEINLYAYDTPIMGQLPVPRTLWVNGQPEVSLFTHSLHATAYHRKNGEDFIDLNIQRDSFACTRLVLVWQDKEHFSGSRCRGCV